MKHDLQSLHISPMEYDMHLALENFMYMFGRRSLAHNARLDAYIWYNTRHDYAAAHSNVQKFTTKCIHNIQNIQHDVY